MFQMRPWMHKTLVAMAGARDVSLPVILREILTAHLAPK
jgi:hypothetical protein